MSTVVSQGLVSTHFVTQGYGLPAVFRDWVWTVGEPGSRWTVGAPSGRWTVGEPESRWTVGEGQQ